MVYGVDPAGYSADGADEFDQGGDGAEQQGEDRGHLDGRHARAASLSFVGPLAERSLDAYHVDKVFFSCKGVHLERGISESNELQARIKQKMIGMADEVVLLADSSKFGVQAFTHVAGRDVIIATPWHY